MKMIQVESCYRCPMMWLCEYFLQSPEPEGYGLEYIAPDCPLEDLPPSQPEDSANQGLPTNQCDHGISWQNPCSQCGRAICR